MRRYAKQPAKVCEGGSPPAKVCEANGEVTFKLNKTSLIELALPTNSNSRRRAESQAKSWGRSRLCTAKKFRLI